MTTQRHDKRGFALLFCAAALTVAACKPQIISGGGTGGGDEGGAGGTGGTGTAVIGGQGGVGGYVGGSAVTGVAEWFSDMNELPMGGSPNIDPNALFVKIGNYNPICGGSFPYDCTPTPSFQFSVGLPPTMQGPGIYSLANPAVISTAQESGQAPGEPGACYASGGQSLQGTIEVLSNDGGTIAFKLQGTGGLDQISADGQYEVPICN